MSKRLLDIVVKIPHTWGECICYFGSSPDLRSIISNKIDWRRKGYERKTNGILHSRESYDLFPIR